MAGGGGRGALTGTAAEPEEPGVGSELPAPPSEASPRRSRDRPSWAVVAVALAVAVVSLGIAAAALLVGSDGGRADSARASALQAARERGAQLTTYDHRRLDEDFAAVLETATGDFEQEYRTTTERLRATFESTMAVAVGEVVAAGIESADLEGEGPERVVVVLAVDQVIVTSGAPARTERNRIRMTLVRPDDTWLVEKVQRL